MKLHNIAYFLREGGKNIVSHGFMSFAAISIIVACLLIIGCFTLLSYNVSLFIDNAEKDNEILAFIDDSMSDAEARSLEKQISAVENVETIEFVSRDEAFTQYSEVMGEDSYLLQGLEKEAVLRHRYRIFLTDISKMRQTAGTVELITGVAKVNASFEISEGIVSIRNVISLISYVLAIVLLGISVFIISNTVKLATFNRREEIAIMKVVGATNGFIRWPFVIEGFLLGIIGGVIAFFCQWGIYEYASIKVVEYMPLLKPAEFGTLLIPFIVVFMSVGLVVGVFGSALTIRKFLRV